MDMGIIGKDPFRMTYGETDAPLCHSVGILLQMAKALRVINKFLTG